MAQAHKAKYVAKAASIDHTPSSAVAAGDVVVQGQIVAIAKTPIAANALGALATRGVFDVVKAAGAITAGARLYWDADGDPVGGTAGTGAATTTATSNQYFGAAIAAAASDDETVRMMLIQDGDVDS